MVKLWGRELFFHFKKEVGVIIGGTRRKVSY